MADGTEPFSQISHPKKRAFLIAFSGCGNVKLSAATAQVVPHTHYDWLANDPNYAAAFATVKKQAVVALEDEAVRRATMGLRRKKFTKSGDPIMDPETGQQYEEHEYSDTLLIFLLKANDPEKFRERHEVKHSGEVKSVVKVIAGVNPEAI